MPSRKASALMGVLAAVVLVAFALRALAAPAGAPIKIGGTLALTGPLAATALLHKITAEIYVEELNRANGLLGRPVEWILLDDQSKPEVTRSLYEKLITVDKVDLLMGPYATGAIIAAMGLAAHLEVDLVDGDELLVEAARHLRLGLIVEQDPLDGASEQAVGAVQLLDVDLGGDLVQERGRR